MTSTFNEAHVRRSAIGRFAEQAHAEPEVSLPKPKVDSTYVFGTLKIANPVFDQATPEMWREINDRVNDSLNFTTTNIIAIGNEVWRETHGVTADQEQAYRTALRRVRANIDEETAEAIEEYVNTRITNSQPLPPLPAMSAPVPDGKTVPMPVDDWRVRAGEVFDLVESKGKTFHRFRPGIHPADSQHMRLQFDRPISDEEIEHLMQASGYAWASKVRGERLDIWHERDTPNSFVVFADMNKTVRSSQTNAADEFQENLNELLADGSVILGNGTRKVEPFDEPIEFELYFDMVHED